MTDLEKRVQDYLTNGGLFNPEMMEHDKVRELIMDLANALFSHRGEGSE
jgi:hypothetical protein